jgi:predicted Zn finger-like uncharacterized protein
MTDSFVTQCPHCQTSFRVSHAQLSVARGVVRCGSCLQVFNAAKQLLEQRGAGSQSRDAATPRQEPPAAIALPAESPTALPVVAAPAPVCADQPAPTTESVAELQQPIVKTQTRQLDLDSLDLDDLDVELARLEQREIQLPETFGQARNHQDIDHVAPMSARRGDADTAQDHWNEALTNDDVEQLPELKAQVIDERDDDSLLQTPFEPDDHHDFQRDDNRTEPSFSSAPDDFDDTSVKQTLFTERGAKDPHDVDHGRDFGLRHEDEELGLSKSQRFSALDDARLEPEDEQPQPLPRNKRGRNEPGLRDEALRDLMDDPLQLDWQKPKPRWGRRILLLLLVLVALGALAGQYVWYHFEELARQDQYRPLFQEICPQVGCKVPAKVDIKLLKSSNLVVRSHPEFQGALVVDAIIYNRASFPQPFPVLELKFADAGGQPVANRRFKPAEYLSGELAGKDEMPPQTPIHIALDVLDPGTKAVNYSLSFRSPE